MTTKTLVDDFTEAAEALKKATDDLENDLCGVTTQLAERLQPTRRRLTAARQQVEALQSESRDDVVDVLDDIDEALHDLHEAVDAARSELAAEQAPHLAGYRKAFNDQTAAWKGRIERLALQADLARMDLRDEVIDVHTDYVNTRRTIRTDLIHAETVGAQTWESIRDRARDELEILGVNYNAVLDKIRRPS